ncbi:MAG TPA: LPS assembly lipoprotein LptE [Alphaproteobacteria bacterium]|nr:LPS assembly lipoprotein LptE [Alphaproteobacteria bacterium]
MKGFRFLLLSAALLQTACGFSPVYGDHAHSAPVAAEMNSVAIDNISDRSGQMLRNDLIDRMYGKGRPQSPRYHLAVSLSSSVEALGIQADATSTRSMMNTTAEYTLNDASGKPILKGTAHSVSSYNVLNDEYASLVSNQSASERTIHEVSEQIVNRLSLYFAERSEPGGSPPPPPPPAPKYSTANPPPPADDKDTRQSPPPQLPAQPF